MRLTFKNAHVNHLCQFLVLASLIVPREVFAALPPTPAFNLFIRAQSTSTRVALGDEYTTDRNFVIVEGEIEDKRERISSCSIRLNGTITSSCGGRPMESVGHRHRVRVNAAISLERQFNEVAIVLRYSRGKSKPDILVKKTFVILKAEKPRVIRAVIVGAPSSPFAVADANGFAQVLRHTGPVEIHLLTGKEASTVEIQHALREIAQEASPRDTVLFYFSGAGYSQEGSGAPWLVTADADTNRMVQTGLGLTDLLWQFSAFQLPASVIIIDASFQTTRSNVPSRQSDGTIKSALDAFGRRPQSRPVEQAAAAWLQPLTFQENRRIILSSRFTEPSFDDSRIGHGTFTEALLRTWTSSLKPEDSRPQCLDLDELSQKVVRYPLLADYNQHPIHYASEDAATQLCFGATESVPPDATHLVPRLGVLHSAGASHGPKVELEDSKLSLRLLLLSSFGKALANLLGTNLEASPPEFTYTTDRARLNLVLTGGQSKIVYYQIENNGAILERNRWRRDHVSEKLELIRRIPLNPGVNQVSIQVDDDQNQFDELRFIVNRPTTATTKALLIGIDQHKDARIKPLQFSGADAELMRALVLRYTEASPSDIVLLRDDAATKPNIKISLHKLAQQSASNPLSNSAQAPDENVLLYFAGYGTSVPTQSGTAARSIIPFDAGLPCTIENCISTRELSDWLDAGHWKNQIVVFDTSYDRDPGVLDAPGDHNLASRTFGDYTSPDETWRTTSDVGQGKIAIVSSQTNQPSLESSEYKHGLFTYGLARTLLNESVSQNRAPLSRNAPQEIFQGWVGRSLLGDAKPIPPRTLLDLYRPISDWTNTASRGLQAPLIKGSLSYPFGFRLISSKELIDRASPVVDLASGDTIAGRLPNLVELSEARRSLEKLLSYRETTAELLPLLPPSSKDEQDAGVDDIVALLGLSLVEMRWGLLDATTKAVHYQQAREYIDRLFDRVNVLSETAAVRNVVQKARLVKASLLERTGSRDEAIVLYREAAANERAPGEAHLLLGAALAAKGHYREAADILRSDDSSGLHAEELGKRLLWRVITLYLQTGKLHKGRLRLYAERGTARGEAKLRFKAVISKLMPFWHNLRESVQEGSIQTSATFPRLVANYLLGEPGHDEDELRSFAKKNEVSDPRDTDAMDCQVEFYIGLKQMLNGDEGSALPHFKLAASKNQTQLLEYWLSDSLARGADLSQH